MSWEAPLVRGARISESELGDLSKRAQEMSKDHEAGSMPVVNGCPTCSKTYSESCPLTWESDEDDLCRAPRGYAGYCARGLHFGGWSVESKIVAEMSCSMCWPCSDGSASNAASRLE
jgi:CPW-WPC domain-containing protein